CLWARARRAGSGTAPRGAVPAARPGWSDAAVLAPLADRRRSGRARGESRPRRARPALRRRCARAVHDRIARFRLGLRRRLRGGPRSGRAGHNRERAPQVPASPGGARRERRRSGPSEIRTAGRRGRGHLGCAAPERDALMRWLVEKALAVPFIIVALAAGLLGVGLWCYSR